MEIFCNEEEELRMGEFSDSLNLIVVAHGLMNDRAKEKLLKLRKDRLTKVTERLGWLRVYHNTYNSDEFIAFLGFID